jgi:threonine synthase
MSALTHLECSACGLRHQADRPATLCETCGKPLLARYDLAAAARTLRRDEVASRPPDMWRYREMMPDPGGYESLGEGFTPIYPARRLGKMLGLKNLFIKDESINPTGSFKARGLAPAVAMARKLGAKTICLPSAGNAGSAAAAYGARIGIPVHAFLPEETPRAFFQELAAYGAIIHRVEGHIGDAGARMRELMAAEPERGWFDVSTLKEPYRLEGKKTMGYELAEQMGSLPDVVIYPTGGGTGLIGMWKAFDEMETLGWIDSRRPRMISVQSSGCAPIVRAFEQGARSAEPWRNPRTIASGLQVPSAIGDFLILDALRASGGRAVAVPEDRIAATVGEIGAAEGVFVAPEGAATVLALRILIEEGRIDAGERVVLFNTGTGLKYLDVLR